MAVNRFIMLLTLCLKRQHYYDFITKWKLISSNGQYDGQKCYSPLVFHRIILCKYKV